METNCRKLVSACVQLGVQPAAVECLFSKDSEIKKVEFTDSPESRKEAASSKFFPRQHPGANGLVQESSGQMEKAGAQPAGRAMQEWLRAAVQWAHAALRRHVPRLFLQQLGRQGPYIRLPIHQELPLLQLYERQPPVITEHVLPTQLYLVHEHVVQHGALSSDGRPGLQSQQPE
ncbi:PITX2 isoform 8 [Pongo abelii]|uniref:PITX2 isoform 8 n=1 Tax=Pongo abelii TaxID=9601 RepID=A0A2J8XQ50_PONAB|nr:PITX2 isoform 8 [Pongo abelii]